MGIKCIFGHRWDGCKCSTCGQTRDEGHNWAKDCETCAICGMTRDGAHDWTKDCEKCARCGATRKDAHKWDDAKCSQCGKHTQYYYAMIGTRIKDAMKKSDTAFLNREITSNTQLLSMRFNGHNLLHLAIVMQNIVAFRFILGFNYDLNERITEGTFKGWTPLHLAAINDNTDIVKELIIKGAQVNSSLIGSADYNGESPLHQAIRARKTKVALCLLKEGASPHVIGLCARPVSLAREFGLSEVLNSMPRLTLDFSGLALSLTRLAGNQQCMRYLDVTVEYTMTTGYYKVVERVAPWRLQGELVHDKAYEVVPRIPIKLSDDGMPLYIWVTLKYGSGETMLQFIDILALANKEEHIDIRDMRGIRQEVIRVSITKI